LETVDRSCVYNDQCYLCQSQVWSIGLGYDLEYSDGWLWSALVTLLDHLNSLSCKTGGVKIERMNDSSFCKYMWRIAGLWLSSYCLDSDALATKRQETRLLHHVRESGHAVDKNTSQDHIALDRVKIAQRWIYSRPMNITQLHGTHLKRIQIQWEKGCANTLVDRTKIPAGYSDGCLGTSLACSALKS
jgi:hypothetical protein